MAINKPSWFSDDQIMISTARTCGLTKGGRVLPKINKKTGEVIRTIDPETNEEMIAIDDELLEDMIALRNGKKTNSLTFVKTSEIDKYCLVPKYYDKTYEKSFAKSMESKLFQNFRSITLGELLTQDIIQIKSGHGSPSQHQRVGEVPYIKVSDLRAGTVNINPTNRVPLNIAKKFWKGPASGLQAFDLLTPERTSKNIGEFCVLMPGQEQVVLTKEILVMRPSKNAYFDSFYLLWALSLKFVRQQWDRIIFMQTNREDIGKRYLEIKIPLPPDKKIALEVSEPFRKYFTTIAKARLEFSKYLTKSNMHHWFIDGGY